MNPAILFGCSVKQDHFLRQRASATHAQPPTPSRASRSTESVDMCAVTFEKAVCRQSVKTGDKYRLVLFASENRKNELRSDYRMGADDFEWKPPFKNPVVLESSNVPVHVSIELRRKGGFGFSGHNVCLYDLSIAHNCQSETYNLRAVRSSIPSPPDLAVTITAKGLVAHTSELRTATESTAINADDPVFATSPGLDPGSLPDIGSKATTTGPDPFTTSSAPRSFSSPQSLPSAPTVHVSGPDDPQEPSFLPMIDTERTIPHKIPTSATSSASQSLPNLAPPRGNDGLLSAAQTAFDAAARDQSSVQSRPSSVLDLSTDSVAPGAETLGEAMWSGVSRLDALVRIITVAADIHPLVKGAWSLLNVAYTLAKDERDLDLRIEDLVHALDTNCDFAKILAENQLTDAAATIVRNILREVLKGASVIQDYCTVRRSKTSMFKFAGSTTSFRVDACLKTLEVFRRDLGDHLAAGVHRDLHSLQMLAATLEGDLKEVKAKIDRIEEFVQTQEDDGLLSQMPNALTADRAMRSSEGGCLPGTRREVIEAIVHWAIGVGAEPSQSYVRGFNPTSRILWLCGVAGSGKSSIAISVARTLRSMDRLGALYGFENAFQTSLNPTNLFTTIARQRAEHQPAHKHRLLRTLRTMNRDQRSTTSSSEQFKAFLIPPAAEDGSVVDDVVVIDAFDEAGSSAARRAALMALSPEAPGPSFPRGVRFIVTSRYDIDVARRLESVANGNQPMVSILRMEDIQARDTERDIRSYVFHMLRDVAGLETAKAVEEITALAMAAEHSFQWASTACLYISQDDDDALRTPMIRLKETLALRSGLDSLYLSILDQHFKSSLRLPSPALQPLRIILGSLMCGLEPLSIRSIAVLASPNGSREMADLETYRLIARRLSSIVTGTHDVITPLIPLHTSFTEFLGDPAHSGDYAVTSQDTHIVLGLGCLAVMRRSLAFNICRLDTSFLRNIDVPDLGERIGRYISDELSYACRFWPAHLAVALSHSSAATESLWNDLCELLADKLRLLKWLEVMSLVGSEAWQSLSVLSHLQARSKDLNDLITFAIHFAIPLRTSASHIYLSALSFTPSSSLIASLRTHFPNLVRYRPPLASWPQIRHSFTHQREVGCVTFSPDGKWVVSAEPSGQISAWDVLSGGAVLPHMRASAPVDAIAFSPDGQFLVSGLRNHAVQLWDMRTMTALGGPLVGHTRSVRSVAFSPDGKLVASGAEDRTIRLWDAQNGWVAVGEPLAAHTRSVTCVAFAPDGLLASSSPDGAIRFWDVRLGAAAGNPHLGALHRGVSCIAFSPDGTLLASGGYDNKIRFWDVQARSLLGEPVIAHTGGIVSLTFSPNGSLLASASRDQTVRLWDVGTRSAVGGPLIGHTGPLWSVAFSPDGSLVASGSADRTVLVREAHSSADDTHHQVAHFHVEPSAAFSFSQSGALLASVSQQKSIQLWNVRTVSTMGEPLAGHTACINAVTFSPDDALIVSASDDCKIRFWDVKTLSGIGELEIPEEGVKLAALSPDARSIATASRGRVRLWSWDVRTLVSDGEPREVPYDWYSLLAFSRDSRLLAFCSGSGTVVQLWDVRSWTSVGQLSQGRGSYRRVWDIVFSPDGTLVATSFSDGMIQLWDVQTQSKVSEFRDPGPTPTRKLGERVPKSITLLAFAPHGTIFAIASTRDKVIRVREVHTRYPFGEPLEGHTSSILSIAFSHDGTHLISSSQDGTVRYWSMQSMTSVRARVQAYEDQPETPFPHSPSTPFLPSIDVLPPLSANYFLQLKDGWLVGPDERLILWIPPTLRSSLSNVHEIARFGSPPLVKLDFSDFVCGANWTHCYAPASG